MGILKYSAQRILTTIAKHVEENLTISMLEKILGMSRVGVWKALKKLESEKMIILNAIGDKENSPYIADLNWGNLLAIKTVALALEQEAAIQRRWIVNFSELEDKVDFLILYGSILISERDANDIDILSIVSKKNVSMEIERAIIKIQKTQLNPIHNIIISPVGLKDELKKPNVAFINAIKKGIVLFGQDKFVKFIREIKQ